MLIKATKPILVQAMLAELKLNKKQLDKLNELRVLYGTQKID